MRACINPSVRRWSLLVIGSSSSVYICSAQRVNDDGHDQCPIDHIGGWTAGVITIHPFDTERVLWHGCNRLDTLWPGVHPSLVHCENESIPVHLTPITLLVGAKRGNETFGNPSQTFSSSSSFQTVFYQLRPEVPRDQGTMESHLTSHTLSSQISAVPLGPRRKGDSNCIRITSTLVYLRPSVSLSFQLHPD